LDGRHDLLGTNDQDNHLAAGRLRLAKALEILVGGVDGILEAIFCLAQTARRRPGLRISLSDLGGHLILKTEQVQEGELVFHTPLIHQSSVAKAQVLQLPKDLNVKVAAGAKVAEIIISTATEIAAGQRAHYGSRGPAQQDTGNERPQPFLAKPHQRRLDEGLLGG
jgi:hypothetical protein